MKLKTVSLLALSVLSPAMVFGLGVRTPDQDAFATARGEAFVATADNPSAIYYNPAGITQLDGSNVRVGVYGIDLNSHFQGAGISAGTSFDTKNKIQALPQLYYTYGFQDVPISVGLGLYAPYGLALEWPDNFPVSPLGRQGSLTYLTLNPVIAWKIIPTLSIAAGPTINYSKLDLHQSAAGPGTDFRFNGDDVEPGFNAGVMWQPITELSFGASYRSATRMKYSGDAGINNIPFPGFSANNHTTAGFLFPQNIVGGVSYRPTPKWNFEFDVDWTDWHALKGVSLPNTPLGPQNLAFNWKSSCFYEFGGTYYFDNDWHVSAGYIYSENSVPDNTYNPLIPDSARHIWSAGVGSKWKNLSWDATYQFAWGPKRTLDGSAPAIIAGTSFEYTSHAIAISVGYHF